MSHPYFGSFDAEEPMILGHRGAAGVAPENTILAFQRCLELGGHAIESDVQVTADGVPVLLHDDNLGRVGVRAVEAASLDLVELSRLDAAHHFSIEERGMTEPADEAAFRGQGHRVPSVEEAFRTFPDARFNLEIKTQANDAVAKVVRLVGELGRSDRTLLVAGDDEIMARLRAEIAAQDVPVATSASLSEIVGVIQSALAGEPPPPEIQALQIPTVFAGNDLVTPALLEHASRHDVKVHVWTINDPEEMNRLLDLGVDGLVTDFPHRAREVVTRRAARS